MRSVALALISVACSHVPPSAPQALRASQVVELSGLPPRHEAGETLTASCARVPGLSGADVGRLVDVALGDVDCSFARLSRLLRARAGEMSAKAIFGKQCRKHAGARAVLECRATTAIPNQNVALGSATPLAPSAPAPSADEVLDLDEPRPRDHAGVRVGFEPAAEAKRAPRVARSYANVAETTWPPVGRAELGQVSARCAEGCDASVLRYALRVTAGRLGAGEVSRVSCFADAGSLRCVATAFAPWSS